MKFQDIYKKNLLRIYIQSGSDDSENRQVNGVIINEDDNSIFILTTKLKLAYIRKDMVVNLYPHSNQNVSDEYMKHINNNINKFNNNNNNENEQ